MQITKKIVGLFVITIIIADHKTTSEFSLDSETRLGLYSAIAAGIEGGSGAALATPAAPIAVVVFGGTVLLHAGLIVMEGQISESEKDQEITKIDLVKISKEIESLDNRLTQESNNTVHSLMYGIKKP